MYWSPRKPICSMAKRALAGTAYFLLIRTTMITPPSGATSVPTTLPIDTPLYKTAARFFSPATVAERKRNSYVGVKRFNPLLKMSKRAAITRIPSATKKPTFKAKRVSFISKIMLFRVGNAIEEPVHHGIGALKGLLRCARETDFALVQHEYPLGDPAGTAHVMSDGY